MPKEELEAGLRLLEVNKKRGGRGGKKKSNSSSSPPAAAPPNPPLTKLDLLLSNLDDMANRPSPFELKPESKQAASLLVGRYSSTSLPELLEEKLSSELAYISKSNQYDDGKEPRKTSMLHDKFNCVDK